MSKSWSGLRKELEEDFLCNSLKGRVQYFLTHYHGAPDSYGRIAIRVDGMEVIQGNPYSFNNKYYVYERDLKREMGVPRRDWTGKGILHDEENKAIERLVEERAIEEGIFEIHHITSAIRTYKHQAIETSLYSENPVIRMFAILDRRVGKRTLVKIAKTVDQQPPWLQYFYRLRLSSQGVQTPMNTRKVLVDCDGMVSIPGMNMGHNVEVVPSGKAFRIISSKDADDADYVTQLEGRSGIHFFIDQVPEHVQKSAIFYPVPYVLIFAYDDDGNYFGTLETLKRGDDQGNPVVLINGTHGVYGQVADHIHDFFALVNKALEVNIPINWQELVAQKTQGILDFVVYDSIEDIKKELIFF